jgi:hypothetical protein
VRARVAKPLNDYSTLDRLLHRLAFSHASVQFAAADCEAAAFGSAFRGLPAERPIFVTSLPRAGTTIILSALNRLPQLGTHLYRDMPFVMAPLLWSRLSRRMQKASTARERAHGDGIRISADSPEAFEEVIWRAFWPEKYAAGGIALWTAGDANPQADAFLRDHFRKIVALRCGERAGEGRYLSKNNANVARIDYLSASMPDATILVPLRRPLDHAASLLLQHRNFLALHERDRFAARYMADIGHFEFGALHRPILFPGFDAARSGLSRDSIDYWLAYWIAAFRHLRSRRDRLTFVSYDALCTAGEEGVVRLCGLLGVDPEGRQGELAREFRAPTAHAALAENAAPGLREEAEAIHAALLAEPAPQAARHLS